MRNSLFSHILLPKEEEKELYKNLFIINAIIHIIDKNL